MTGSHSSLKQIRQILAACVVTVMMATFVYGLVLFPDAPVKKCINGQPGDYCGRHGLHYTATDYATFETWQTTLFVVWPVGLLALVILLRPKVRGT